MRSLAFRPARTARVILRVAPAALPLVRFASIACALCLVLLPPPARAQQTPPEAPRAALLPGAIYEVAISRVYGGNDGTKDVIPSVAEQRVRIETGDAQGGGIPLTLTVYSPRNTDNPKGYIGDPAPEWTFAATLTADGAFTDFSYTSPEAGTAEAFARGVLASQLRDALFLPAADLAGAKPRRLTVTAVAPQDGGRSAVAYAIETGVAGDESSEPIVTATTGTAVWDPALQCYPQRGMLETTTMYIPSDAGAATKIVAMTVKTTITVSVTKR